VTEACTATSLSLTISCLRVVKKDGELSDCRWASNANAFCSNGRRGHEWTGSKIIFPAAPRNVTEQVAVIDWEKVSGDLDTQGSIAND